MSDFNTRVNDLVNEILDRQKNYLAECEDYRERGHRHNYCFHGMNMWVDYDCACGACEDGEINEYSSRDEIVEYAEDVIRGEMRVENKKKEEKMALIELLMKSDKNYSFDQAEKIYAEIFG